MLVIDRRVLTEPTPLRQGSVGRVHEKRGQFIPKIKLIFLKRC